LGGNGENDAHPKIGAGIKASKSAGRQCDELFAKEDELPEPVDHCNFPALRWET
jgi:hypothetical protein